MPTKLTPGQKAARTRKLRAAGKKAAKTRKQREAGRKAAATRNRRQSAAKSVVIRHKRGRRPSGVKRRQFALMVSDEEREMIDALQKAFGLDTATAAVRQLIRNAYANIQQTS